ncbi:phage tail protein [Burkholderia ubonensis]|uniref:phage tail protein n=1 Tax=Burkholderia ubonensis TaxID=101571 RepID=UPI000756A9DD|nr:phage tail protein [Burkholderia ubonensis]KVU21732.1 phage tail protein [Burkholderia ubonensis]
MAGNLIQITDAGRAALVAAGNTGTVARRVIEIGIGTAAFAFDKGMTALPNERKRVTTFGGENVAPDTVHVVIQDDTDDQYSLYAYGLYLDNGVLFGVYVQSTPILEKSPAAMLLLASDIVFASIDAAQLQFGPATFLNPPATTERKGVIELATQAEVDDGTDDTRAVTPKTASNRYAALNGATFTGPVNVAFDAGDELAHVSIMPPSGALGRQSRVRLFGTFSAPATDTERQHVATISAGFDGGAWGKQYVDLWMNADANQSRVVRVTLGGVRIAGDMEATGNGRVRALYLDGGAGSFSTLYFLSGGKNRFSIFKDDDAEDGTGAGSNLRINGFADDGKTQGTAVIVNRGTLAVTLPKRLIVGSTSDDGASALQVAGRIAVSRATGEGQVALGKNDGYFYGNEQGAGFWSSTQGRFQYVFADRTFRINDKTVWHEGNLDPLDKTKGGTMGGDLAFAPDKRIVLAEGSRGRPSLTFANDDGTGLYHTGDGSFDVASKGQTVLRFTPSLAAFDQAVTGPTPPTGDRSTRLATTEWVLAAISTTAIGQIVFEPRTTVRAGFVKANGAVVNRADYPALWAYAQASGALVSDDEWQKGRFACFSTGDGATTFRLPEMRGEFIRCWDDARSIDKDRMIGSWQDSTNRLHSHGASASEVGDHAHSAWTDTQGWHGHGVNDPGHNHGVNDPGHVHGAINISATGRGSYLGTGTSEFSGGGSTRFGVDGTAFPTHGAGTGIWLSGSGTGIWLNGDGNHAHNVGIGGAGRHSHAITVNGDGANEARPRNVALLAMIRAF